MPQARLQALRVRSGSGQQAPGSVPETLSLTGRLLPELSTQQGAFGGVAVRTRTGLARHAVAGDVQDRHRHQDRHIALRGPGLLIEYEVPT